MQEGKNSDAQHDDTDASHPLQDAAPQQQAFRHAVQPHQDGRTGSRYARHRLKKGIGKGKRLHSQIKRQCSDYSEQAPTGHSNQVKLLARHLKALARGSDKPHTRERTANQAGGQKSAEYPTWFPQRQQGTGDGHGCRQHQHE